MNFISAQDVFFDDKAILVMGAAFDEACGSLRRFARYKKVRELIAKRIIEAAKTGELDPIRLIRKRYWDLASMMCRCRVLAWTVNPRFRSMH